MSNETTFAFTPLAYGRGARLTAPSIDPLDDLFLLALAFLLLGAVDRLMQAAGWFENKSSGRYFSLHVLVNAYVTAVHFKV